MNSGPPSQQESHIPKTNYNISIMCGFTAIFDIQGDSLELRDKALQMSRKLRHRGPDWSGIYCGKTAILSHERLSIVDPQSGGQPLISPHHKHILAVNGEIYNHANYGKGWNDFWFSNPWEGLTKGGFNSMAESRGLSVGATAFMTIQPIKGLKFRSQFNFGWYAGAYRNYAEPRSPSSGSGTVASYSVSQNQNMSTNYSIENTITYDLPIIAGNKISVMAGQSFQSSAWSSNLSGSNKVADGDQLATLKGWNSAWLNNIKLVSATDASLGGNPNDEEYLASWFGRLNWDYNEKYMATVTMRYDGSSIFNKGNRWGFFPSVSAGWVISNENFMESTSSWMDFLKFRASWGQNGNNRIPKYQYLATIAQSGGNNDNGYKFDDKMETTTSGTPNTGAYANIVPNPDLTWETSEQLDFGLDARFLSDRLTLGIDWYKKTTKDLLLQVTGIPEIGGQSQWVNTGKVLNQGLDIELGWRDRVADFNYGVNANFSPLKNEVQEVSSVYPRITETGVSGFNNKLQPTFEKGHQVWYFRGFKYAGVDPQTGAAQYYDKEGKLTSAPSDDDKQDLGSAIPTFTYGITINLEWKGFDLTIFGTGAAGNKIYNLMVSADTPKINGINTYWKNSWKQAGDNTKYPDMKQVSTDWTFFSSDAAVFNGSFFKFKQIQLGYTLPKKLIKKALLSDARVSVSLDDYFVITSYPGADPEVTTSGTGVGSRGFDNGTYPMSKKLVFGVNLTF